MALIDYSYFKGEVELPGLKATRKYSDSEAVGMEQVMQTIGEKNFNYFINEYEPEFLIQLLGHTLYENFMEGLREVPVPEIWTSLKERLTHSETDKISPIAYYVYQFTKESGRTKTTPSGEKRFNVSYTESVSDSDKMQRVTYRLNRIVKEFYCWLDENWVLYKPYANNQHSIRRFRPGISNVFGV